MVILMMCQPENVLQPVLPLFPLFGPCSQYDEILTFFAVTAIAMVISMTCQQANVLQLLLALFGPFWPFLAFFVPILHYCQNIEILTFFAVIAMVISMMCQPANVFALFCPLWSLLSK